MKRNRTYEANEPGIDVFNLSGINKKMNNLLGFDDFEKTFEPKKQKSTKRTDVGLDIINEQFQDEEEIEVSSHGFPVSSHGFPISLADRDVMIAEINRQMRRINRANERQGAFAHILNEVEKWVEEEEDDANYMDGYAQ